MSIPSYTNHSKKQLVEALQDMERQNARLTEQLDQFQKIFEKYPDAYIMIIERDLSIGYLSGQEIFSRGGTGPPSSNPSLDEIFRDKTAEIMSRLEECFDGKDQSFEFFLDNDYYYFRTAPLDSDQEMNLRILVVAENITERKRVEETLRLKLMEVEKFNKLMVGRELKMIELKKEINSLCKKNNIPEKYTVYE